MILYVHGVPDQNKHCKILVSCSDKERNCIQAHGASCKLIELYEVQETAMQAQGTACKVMDLHGSLCNFM